MEKKLSYELGPNLGNKTSFGLIVLQNDETIEDDMRRLLPDSSALLYCSRVPSGAEVTCKSLKQMEEAITGSAMLFPDAVSFSVVGYGCTSGTSVIGVRKIKNYISQGCKATIVTEPVSALLASCKALNVSNIAFLSPYVAGVSANLRSLLEKNGLKISVFGTFDEAIENKVARITSTSLANAVLDLVSGTSAEAVFMSCTNLKTLDIIESIEDTLNIPVMSSNLVLAWHMLELAGLKDQKPCIGKLMKDI